MLLNELFDKPLPYKITKRHDGLDAFFSAGEYEYEVEINQYEIDGEQVAMVEFSNLDANSRQGITGTGNAVEVFSTVIRIIREYIKTSNIKVLKFSAMEPSRKKLYTRLVNVLAKDGWSHEFIAGMFLLRRE